MFDYLKNKRVLITGAGSLAHGLAKELKCSDIAALSRNEASQFQFLEKFKNAKCYMGDIKDEVRVNMVFREFRPDVVIHTAACKRVDVAQLEPINTIKNNIIGSINIIEAAYRNNVEACINIDTDKSVDSQTYYGHTKNLASAAFLDMNKLGSTKFSVVRYGNILCSRSSVAVIWTNAAQTNSDIKITNPEMTRFYFTIDEGVKLIEYGLKNTLTTPHGHGKIYCTEMCAGTLSDLADVIVDCNKSKSKQITVGARVSAEKMDEVLISKQELKDTIKTEDFFIPFYSIYKELYYFIISPGSNKTNISEQFTSATAPRLSKEELKLMYEWAVKNTYQN